MMSEVPTISILMAAKDAEPYLRDCLDSILAQTFTDWELVIVNDHSTDSTQQIIEEFAVKDARIRPSLNDGERLLAALKTGYTLLRGQLVNRMDADDIMPSYKLALMHEAWLKGGIGSVVTGGTKHFVAEGEVGDGCLRYDKWLNEVARTAAHYREIYRECVFPSNCWLVHKQDLNTMRAFQDDIYPEDYDLCFRFYEAGLTVIPMDKVLHHWRDRSDRISRTWDEYKDNRFFKLKVSYFFKIDRDTARPLVLWGAGKNGKDLAKLLLSQEPNLHWICNNPRKIGKDIYGVIMRGEELLNDLNHPQILVVVSNPSERQEVKEDLLGKGFKEGEDFWFFL